MAQIIPQIIGGFLMSTAVTLNNRYSKTELEPRKSFYNIFSFGTSMRWIISFISGMIFTAALGANMFSMGGSGSTAPFETNKLYFEGTSLVQSLIAAFLIGVGTRLGGKVLTRYAFSGVPQFNPQSLLCMIISFIFAAGAATLRSSMPLLQGLNFSRKFSEHLDFRIPIIIPLAMLALNIAKNYNSTNSIKEILGSFGIGSLLASGMLMAGLARRHLVLDFFSFNKNWNPALAFIFLGIFLGLMIMPQFFPKSRIATTVENASARVQQVFDPRAMGAKMFFGSALYGIGKGMFGLCLGSALLVSPVYFPHAPLFILPSILAGRFVGGMVDNFTTGKGLSIKKGL